MFWPILRTHGSSSSGFSSASASRRSDLARGRRRRSEVARAVAVAERHVAGLARRDRQREADELGAHRRRGRSSRCRRRRGRRRVRRRSSASSALARRDGLVASSGRTALLADAWPASTATAAGDAGRRRLAADRVCRRRPPAASRFGAPSSRPMRPAAAAARRPGLSAMRLVSVLNSIARRNAEQRLGVGSCTPSASIGDRRPARRPSRRTSSREMRAWSANSISFSRRFGCLISPARASSVSRSPYSLISSAAVLTPMPGTPGTLSTQSPASDCTSTTLSGGTPNFSITSSRPMRLFFMVSSIDDAGPTSCIRSLSDETMVTSPPASTASRGVGGDQVVGLVAVLLDAGDVERLARRRGSAGTAGSDPPAAAAGAPCTRRRSRCGTSSRDGVEDDGEVRRRLRRLASRAAASTACAQKPCTAPTGRPSDGRVSGGSAWKARKM